MEINGICKCPRCKGLGKFNDIKTEENSDGIFLITQYICDCGNIYEFKEKFTFNFRR